MEVRVSRPHLSGADLPRRALTRSGCVRIKADSRLGEPTAAFSNNSSSQLPTLPRAQIGNARTAVTKAMRLNLIMQESVFCDSIYENPERFTRDGQCVFSAESSELTELAADRAERGSLPNIN